MLASVSGIRHELGLSQAELADLMGVSPRAVQSWEQGWRHPSAALEKSLLLLLLAWRGGEQFASRACWESVRCSQAERGACLAYRSRQGHLCWFLTGNICHGKRVRTWAEKRAICGDCSFFRSLLGGSTEPEGGGDTPQPVTR